MCNFLLPMTPEYQAFVEIWLSGFGFCLSMTDFKILKTVVQTAMNWLACQPSVSQAKDLQKISFAPRRKPQHVQKKFLWN